MAQRISELTKVTEITETDELVITDFNDANSTKGVDISVLFDAVNRLKNENAAAAEPSNIKIWTGTRADYDNIATKDTDTLYITKPGTDPDGAGIFIGTDSVIQPADIQAYDEAGNTDIPTTGTASLAPTGYQIRIVDNGEIPDTPDANTIYLERVS